MPALWGSVFFWFSGYQRLGPQAHPLVRLLGPGGHYLLAACGMLVACGMSTAIRPSELSLDAAGSPTTEAGAGAGARAGASH